MKHSDTPLPAEDEDKLYRWFIHGEREQADEQSIRHFARWLAENPRRQQKADTLQAIWNSPDLRHALTLTEAEAHPQKITPAARRFRHTLRYGALAASLLLAVIIALPGSNTAPLRYETRIKQLAQEVMKDGSQIDLSADSKVLVSYSRAERHIDLLQGEAQFSVSKDPDRPFVVQTQHAQLKALGTVFNVDQRRNITELTVLEGRVEVVPAQVNRKRLVIRAGEKVRIQPQGTGPVESFDLQAYQGWQEDVLQADNMPLAELIDELNRYRDIPVSLTEDIRNLPVTGTFRLSDSRKNLDVIASAYRLRLDEQNGQPVITR